ncbi:acetyl/propionyl/methylcrotonyl-CoA carboxylase subunit alpha [Vibrio sinensis]|uniref:Biotin carboxylase n=1 Tax=Vibrio sinensis TaxID=2302434 RepID=A0A3A6QTA5_9VIBR|nr:acetyl/propionyl/methylcrotonyl-CoA carboxylase subunit alpha [Vibrio sinensis]RJX75603.1 acetyl/propionyl/methylcrotonyl-CoA carboxylase subunit alpha [Vibrio sinensis]
MIKRVLIANRGEIACRIIKTAKRMAIETVAVYSDADKHSLHVKQADYAEHIGPSPASESYLNIDAIIVAAKKWQADAIHPGYGFLSENALLAQACCDNDIVFIGPSSRAIEQMGSKSQAKTIMANAKVPLVPGYHGADNSVSHLLAEAEKIGYPVMLKATQGGGGKGMRVVHNASEMPLAIDGAQRESLSSFGDDQLLIEKCILKPRHVEIQVFADAHGHCLYLSDRDCSIQRRHQKVVEEAPAPGLSEPLRQKMGQAAVLAAKAINYVGAGTVEFLLDEDEQFYFMEMNTRLQVEHPVTELITNIDLVEWQFNIASGNALPITQHQITHYGHAIELRVYAEDTNNNFMPSTGRIDYMMTPPSNHHIRLDSGIEQGNQISEFYDPMISKLITWGETRDIALTQLKQALKQYQICGVTTNIGYLYSIIDQAAFADSKLNTDFLVEHQDSIAQLQNIAPSIWLTFAAVARRLHLVSAKSEASPAPSSQGFRLSQNNQFRFNFTRGSENSEVLLTDNNQYSFDSFKVTIDSDISHAFVVDIDINIDQSKQITIELNGVRYCYSALIDQHDTTIFFLGQQRTFAHHASYQPIDDTTEDLSPSAPLNGLISAILVNEGDSVESGQPLLVLEAMKMEYTIFAPQPAMIESILYQIGDQVQHGAVLVQLLAESKDSPMNTEG